MNRRQVRLAAEAQAAFFAVMLDEADREVEAAIDSRDRFADLAERKSRELTEKERECESLKAALAEAGQKLAEEQLRRAEYQGNDARCRRALAVLAKSRSRELFAPDSLLGKLVGEFAEALEGPPGAQPSAEDRSSVLTPAEFDKLRYELHDAIPNLGQTRTDLISDVLYALRDRGLLRLPGA